MRAIVFSGGGSRGQFHVGVVKHLLLDRATSYDLFGGVSVGALVAAVLAQYRAGLEVEAYNALDRIFSEVTSASIYKRWWPFGKAHGLFGKSSFLNSAPLEALVRKGFDRKRVLDADKMLHVGCASITTGEYKIFDQLDAEITNAVIASAAMPAFFRPVKIGTEMWFDGGVREVTPIADAIGAGATEIDVVICQPKNERLKFDEKPSAMTVAGRALGLMCDALVWADVKKAELYTRLAVAGLSDKRAVDIRVFAPTSVLNADALKFDPTEAKALQSEGYAVARSVCGQTRA